MKKPFILTFPGLMLAFVLASCFHNHNMSITVSDDDDEYEMNASYQEHKTHRVEVYLNEHLVERNIISFEHYEDDEIALDDNTTLYIKSQPGKLRIKIDKDKNSAESCERVRHACNEIKEILTAY